MRCLQPDVMANLLTNVEIEIESGLQKNPPEAVHSREIEILFFATQAT